MKSYIINKLMKLNPVSIAFYTWFILRVSSGLFLSNPNNFYIFNAGLLSFILYTVIKYPEKNTRSLDFFPTPFDSMSSVHIYTHYDIPYLIIKLYTLELVIFRTLNLFLSLQSYQLIEVGIIILGTLILYQLYKLHLTK